MTPRDTWNIRLAAAGWRQPETIGDYALPDTSRFAPTKDALCPFIFDRQGRMLPEIRSTVLAYLDSFWIPKYGEWRLWAHVYLAGSLASYWWGKLDFDVLVGVNTPLFEKLHPEFRGMSDVECCKYLTDELRPLKQDNFSFPSYRNPDQSLVTELTIYVNAGAYDIRNLKPYAAYSIDEDRWAVHPMRMGKSWGSHQFAHNFWVRMQLLADSYKAILALPEPLRASRAAQAYEELHKGRNDAYGPQGVGLFDPRSIAWTLMSEWGILGPLIEAAHRHTAVLYEADRH